MAYSIPDCFMAAFVMGFLFGLLYEALRIVRLVLRLKVVVFICDVAFFVISAYAVFNLSLVLGNYIRIYTILGYGAGIFAYITTIGRILNGIELVMAIVWRKTIGRFLRFIGRNIKKSVVSIVQYFKTGFGDISDFSRKTGKSVKKHLHLPRKVLYNKKDKIGVKGSVSRNVIQADIRRIP